MLLYRTYWDGVPDIYKDRLHYYNAPITAEIANADHPVNIIRSIYRPGDFIAVKLDIDNSPIETAFVDAIETDPDLLHSIGEMFYEQHYDHSGALLAKQLPKIQCSLIPFICNFKNRYDQDLSFRTLLDIL